MHRPAQPLRTVAGLVSLPAARKNVMLKWADLIEANALELAVLGVRDNGTEIGMALKAEPGSAAGTIRYYAEALDKIYGEIAPTGHDVLGMIHKEPVGVVGAIIPWNFPMMIGAWKLGPALAMGNSVVLKPAETASLSLMRMVELALEAGLPPWRAERGHRRRRCRGRSDGTVHGCRRAGLYRLGRHGAAADGILCTVQPEARLSGTWAANPPTSSLQMRPIWTRPPKVAAMRYLSQLRGRSASPARGCWWTRRSTMISSPPSSKPPKPCASVIHLFSTITSVR